MRLHKNSNGFGVIGILFLVLVAVVIAGTGWYVWGRNRDDESTTSNQPTLNSQGTTEPTPSTPVSETEYIDVTEWGLRFTVPEDLKGNLTYVVNDTAERLSGGPVRIDILSKTFSAGSLKCSEKETATSRSIVSFYKETEGEGGTTTPAPFRTIGTTRYYFAGTSCEEAIEREGTAADKRLLADIKSAVTDTLVDRTE